MHLSDFARMESVSDQLKANSCDFLLLELSRRFILVLLFQDDGWLFFFSFLLLLDDSIVLFQLHLNIITLVLLIDFFEHIDEDDVAI